MIQLIFKPLWIIFICFFFGSGLFAQNPNQRVTMISDIQFIELAYDEGVKDRNALFHITNAGDVMEVDSTFQYLLTFNILEIDFDQSKVVELTNTESIAIQLSCKNNLKCLRYKQFEKKEKFVSDFEVFINDNGDDESLNKVIVKMKRIQEILNISHQKGQ